MSDELLRIVGGNRAVIDGLKAELDYHQMKYLLLDSWGSGFFFTDKIIGFKEVSGSEYWNIDRVEHSVFERMRVFLEENHEPMAWALDKRGEFVRVAPVFVAEMHRADDKTGVVIGDLGGKF